MDFNIFNLSQLVTDCTPTPLPSCSLDKSVEMLGDIFGTPAIAAIPSSSGVLVATNSPHFVSLFSMMVTYFDWALVGIVGLVFSYIVIMATINTAHEGVAFGRQHNSTYTLIRAILGPVLMFPIPTVIPSSGTIVSSFSALQAIVMHLVLIGVNMANIVWYHTVGAAMYMPPSQLPGPIQSMVAQQVGKLYAYQAAFRAMGFNSLDSSDSNDAPTFGMTSGTQKGYSDAVLYSQLMAEFGDYCSKQTSQTGLVFNQGVSVTTTPTYTQCIAALQKLQASHATGVIYPLSAGPDINNAGGSEFSSSFTGFYTGPDPYAGNSSRAYNGPNQYKSPWSPFFWMPTVAIYSQFRFSYGTNAPFWDNGLFNLSNVKYQLSNLSSVATASGNPPANPFPPSITSITLAMGHAGEAPPTTEADQILAQLSAMIEVNTANNYNGSNIATPTSYTPGVDPAPGSTNIFNSVVSLDTLPAVTPTVQPVNCNFGVLPPGLGTQQPGSPVAKANPDGTVSGPSLCDLGSTVNYLTQTLISNQASNTSNQAPPDVPGTGATCVPVASITGVAVDNITAPTTSGIVGDPQTLCTKNGGGYYGTATGTGGTPYAGCFGTVSGVGSSSNAVCVNQETSYISSNKLPIVLYYPIAEQDYQNSWWYGSEVYLSITQRLADNIKAIADAINQFAIDDDSLEATSMGGTKTTSINAYQFDRFQQGHTIYQIKNLTNGNVTLPYSFEHLLLGPNPQPAENLTFYLVSPGSQPPAGVDNNLILNTTALVTPSWDQIVCLFDPGVSGSAAQGTLQFLNVGDPNCYSANADVVGNIKLPTATSSSSGSNPAALPGSLGAALFNELPSVPKEYQTPISLLIMWELQTNFGSSNAANYNDQLKSIKNLEQDLANIITVLKLNHVYGGVDTGPGIGIVQEVGPANSILNQIFSNVLGKNTPGSMNVNSNLGGVMTDIYSIGNQQINDPSSDGGNASVMESSYNNIAQVQQVGLEMINVVIASMQSVYQSIQATADANIKTDQNYFIGMTVAAAAGSASASALGAFAATAITGQVVASVTQIGELATSTMLQFEIVKQGYQMANLLMWLPLLIMVSSALFTAGVSFALIVPIMPFILFWSGQISWLLSVMEAVIAAPLLCLAWAVPGGHTHMGHTLSGVKVLIGVVFRPVLMVLGLFSALILTFILIKFSSQAFQIVSSQILGFAQSMGAQAPIYWQGTQTVYTNNATMTTGILAVLMLLLFCSLMVMAFNKCFSMIYMIPEKVLGWIGIQVQSTGAQDAEKLSGGVTQSASQGAQAAGSTMSQGAQAQSSHSAQSGSTDSQAGGAISSGGQQVYQTAKQPKGKGKAGNAERGGSTPPTP